MCYSKGETVVFALNTGNVSCTDGQVKNGGTQLECNAAASVGMNGDVVLNLCSNTVVFPNQFKYNGFLSCSI